MYTTCYGSCHKLEPLCKKMNANRTVLYFFCQSLAAALRADGQQCFHVPSSHPHRKTFVAYQMASSILPIVSRGFAVHPCTTHLFALPTCVGFQPTFLVTEAIQSTFIADQVVPVIVLAGSLQSLRIEFPCILGPLVSTYLGTTMVFA